MDPRVNRQSVLSTVFRQHTLLLHTITVQYNFRYIFLVLFFIIPNCIQYSSIEELEFWPQIMARYFGIQQVQGGLRVDASDFAPVNLFRKWQKRELM